MTKTLSFLIRYPVLFYSSIRSRNVFHFKGAYKNVATTTLFVFKAYAHEHQCILIVDTLFIRSKKI